MVEPYEIFNLFASLVFIVILIRIFYRKNQPEQHYFTVGVMFVLMSNFFTVIEGFAFELIFNFLEHFSFTVGTFFFFLGSLKLLNANGRAHH